MLMGKGEIVCGNKECGVERGLEDYEFNFRYVEKEERKNALVKAKLCKACEQKMNFKFFNNIHPSGGLK